MRTDGETFPMEKDKGPGFFLLSHPAVCRLALNSIILHFGPLNFRHFAALIPASVLCLFKKYFLRGMSCHGRKL